VKIKLERQYCRRNSLELGKKVENWNNNNKNEFLGITYKTYHPQVIYKTEMCEFDVASSGITCVPGS
jgi:hypothetical protein